MNGPICGSFGFHGIFLSTSTLQFKERLTSQKMSSKNSILPFISIWLHYKTELSARNKAETGIRYEWYAMQRWGANYWDDAYPELGYYLTTIGNKVWR